MARGWRHDGLRTRDAKWVIAKHSTNGKTYIVNQKLNSQSKDAIFYVNDSIDWKDALDDRIEINEIPTNISEMNPNLLTRALSSLPPSYERIIRMRFGLGVQESTFEEIGKVFNLTRERIRQIECRSLRMLNRYFRRNLDNTIIKGMLSH